MQTKRWFMLAGVLAALVALAVLVAACGDDDDGGETPTATEPGATEPAATEPAATEPAATEPAATEPAATEPPAAKTVDVSLVEFTVNRSEGTVAAGTVTFNVSNDGNIIHTFRVIKTDLAPDALPTAANKADESQLDVVASIPDFGAGETREVAATLEAGSYVLICNFIGHYQSGMTVAFTVE